MQSSILNARVPKIISRHEIGRHTTHASGDEVWRTQTGVSFYPLNGASACVTKQGITKKEGLQPRHWMDVNSLHHAAAAAAPT